MAISRCTPQRFQPSLPLRGATANRDDARGVQAISTLAPLAGSDHAVIDPFASLASFQPSLPLRGATHHEGTRDYRDTIVSGSVKVNTSA